MQDELQLERESTQMHQATTYTEIQAWTNEGLDRTGNRNAVSTLN